VWSDAVPGDEIGAVTPARWTNGFLEQGGPNVSGHGCPAVREQGYA